MWKETTKTMTNGWAIVQRISKLHGDYVLPLHIDCSLLQRGLLVCKGLSVQINEHVAWSTNRPLVAMLCKWMGTWLRTCFHPRGLQLKGCRPLLHADWYKEKNPDCLCQWNWWHCETRNFFWEWDNERLIKQPKEIQIEAVTFSEKKLEISIVTINSETNAHQVLRSSCS